MRNIIIAPFIIDYISRLVDSKTCQDNSTSLVYKHGQKIHGHPSKQCFLCSCEYDGSFSCFEHGCSILNCLHPKFGEVECCKLLKCKSIYF